MTSAEEVEQLAQEFELNVANPFNPEHKEEWKRRATLLRTLLRERDEAVIAFAKSIEHGDDIHKEWLREAAQCFVKRQALPDPRSAPNDARSKALDEAAKVEKK